jgi:hypothetical protein
MRFVLRISGRVSCCKSAAVRDWYWLMQLVLNMNISDRQIL